MRWHHLAIDHCVLELPSGLQLLLWYGGGVRTRAAWRWSGRLASWAAVGEA
jgi:hypothetical protein